MGAKKSLITTTICTSLESVIEACYRCGVDNITMADGTAIKFKGGAGPIQDELSYASDEPAVDTDADIVDNTKVEHEIGYADRVTSAAALEDELENLALSDPLEYEELLAKQIRQDADARN